MPESAATCHIISHVHWDREWYRTFDAYRGRLVELVERVCSGLEEGRYASFHLDGQTVILADALEIRPDFEPRLRELVEAGRLTVGPWHVLADNQLVSAENLVRNLLKARSWGRRIGNLSSVGYSPDAFGHPADLPRLLNGFGLDTALVWRGAPPEHRRFRWISPDGSEVLTVNRAYHQTEILWNQAACAEQLTEFVATEQANHPDTPLLLLNGGDHLVPPPPRERSQEAELAGVDLIESTLESFFAHVKDSPDHLPSVTGELRAPGDRLTFLLPGTLSARTCTKLDNENVQTLLERFVEPQLARRAISAPSRAAAGASAALLDHAWDLVLKNAPHDSICGCSIDEVHRNTTVRAERARETGELLLQRTLLQEGLDTRVHGAPADTVADLAVVSGLGDTSTGAVQATVLTAAGYVPVRITGPDGQNVPFDVNSTITGKTFEADLDLLPDTRDSATHRLSFIADDVPSFGWQVYRVHLHQDGSEPATMNERRISSGCYSIVVNDDASLTVMDRGTGRTHENLGRLTSVGDRGDTYNFDPLVGDSPLTPTVRDVRVSRGNARTRIDIDAVLSLPESLTADRESRSHTYVDSPLHLSVTHWSDTDRLEWHIRLDNRASDHRLRFEVPLSPHETVWTADQHWSTITRPIGSELGTLPTEPAFEAQHSVAPVHTWAGAGSGGEAVAVLTRGLPEFQAFTSEGGGTLAVTVLRAVGWLSRFDLRTRTTGAGPMMEVPDAQCHGPLTAHLAVVLGEAAEPASPELIRQAAQHRVPFRAYQLRSGADVPAIRSADSSSVRVTGALVSCFKPADQDGGKTVLRVYNPTGGPVTVNVRLPRGTVSVLPVRIDETVSGEPVHVVGDPFTWQLPAYGLQTFLFH